METSLPLEKTAPAPRRRRVSIPRIALQVLVAVLAVTWVVPLWIMVVTPMKTFDEYVSGSQWALPKDPANLMQNIGDAWNTAGLGSGFMASLLYGVSGAALAILFGSMGAYA